MASDHNPGRLSAGDSSPLPRPPAAGASARSAALRAGIQERCWESLGLERNAAGLAALAEWLEEARRESDQLPANRAAAETRNLVEVAWAMTCSAAFRQESRGAHFRTDFPRADDERFRGHTLLDRAGVRLADVEEPLAVRA